MGTEDMEKKLTIAQRELIQGKRDDSRLAILDLPKLYRIPARSEVAVTYHCCDTTIARALQLKGLLETSVKLAHGKRRSILTLDGKRKVVELLKESMTPELERRGRAWLRAQALDRIAAELNQACIQKMP